MYSRRSYEGLEPAEAKAVKSRLTAPWMMKLPGIGPDPSQQRFLKDALSRMEKPETTALAVEEIRSIIADTDFPYLGLVLKTLFAEPRFVLLSSRKAHLTLVTIAMCRVLALVNPEDESAVHLIENRDSLYTSYVHTLFLFLSKMADKEDIHDSVVETWMDLTRVMATSSFSEPDTCALMLSFHAHVVCGGSVAFAQATFTTSKSGQHMGLPSTVPFLSPLTKAASKFNFPESSTLMPTERLLVPFSKSKPLTNHRAPNHNNGTSNQNINGTSSQSNNNNVPVASVLSRQASITVLSHLAAHLADVYEREEHYQDEIRCLVKEFINNVIVGPQSNNNNNNNNNVCSLFFLKTCCRLGSKFLEEFFVFWVPLITKVPSSVVSFFPWLTATGMLTLSCLPPSNSTGALAKHYNNNLNSNNRTIADGDSALRQKLTDFDNKLQNYVITVDNRNDTLNNPPRINSPKRRSPVKISENLFQHGINNNDHKHMGFHQDENLNNTRDLNNTFTSPPSLEGTFLQVSKVFARPGTRSCSLTASLASACAAVLGHIGKVCYAAFNFAKLREEYLNRKGVMDVEPILASDVATLITDLNKLNVTSPDVFDNNNDNNDNDNKYNHHDFYNNGYEGYEDEEQPHEQHERIVSRQVFHETGGAFHARKSQLLPDTPAAMNGEQKAENVLMPACIHLVSFAAKPVLLALDESGGADPHSFLRPYGTISHTATPQLFFGVGRAVRGNMKALGAVHFARQQWSKVYQQALETAVPEVGNEDSIIYNDSVLEQSAGAPTRDLSVPSQMTFQSDAAIERRQNSLEEHIRQWKPSIAPKSSISSSINSHNNNNNNNNVNNNNNNKYYGNDNTSHTNSNHQSRTDGHIKPSSQRESNLVSHTQSQASSSSKSSIVYRDMSYNNNTHNSFNAMSRLSSTNSFLPVNSIDVFEIPADEYLNASVLLHAATRFLLPRCSKDVHHAVRLVEQEFVKLPPHQRLNFEKQMNDEFHRKKMFMFNNVLNYENIPALLVFILQMALLPATFHSHLQSLNYTGQVQNALEQVQNFVRLCDPKLSAFAGIAIMKTLHQIFYQRERLAIESLFIDVTQASSHSHSQRTTMARDTILLILLEFVKRTLYKPNDQFEDGQDSFVLNVCVPDKELKQLSEVLPSLFGALLKQAQQKSTQHGQTKQSSKESNVSSEETVIFAKQPSLPQSHSQQMSSSRRSHSHQSQSQYNSVTTHNTTNENNKKAYKANLLTHQSAPVNHTGWNDFQSHKHSARSNEQHKNILHKAFASSLPDIVQQSTSGMLTEQILSQHASLPLN